MRYRLIERKRGASLMCEFDDHEPFWNVRDAAEEAERLAAHRRRVSRNPKWVTEAIFVRSDEGETVYEIRL